MSAIWGIVDLNGHELPAPLAERMAAPYRGKKIDRVDAYRHGPTLLACGLQYFTPEAPREAFPYRAGGRLLVADAVLDNRAELLRRCTLPADAPDGAILAECFFAQPEAALQDMLGAYAFAVYDPGVPSLTLCNDAMGVRSVYYSLAEGRACFSSLLRPILAAHGQPAFNERWLADFFAQDSLVAVTEPCETQYQGVFRLAPGECVVLSRQGVHKTAYWRPQPARVPRGQTEAECERRFLETFETAVTDTLRSAGETGILLSGGLDSSAVAAWAAPALARRGRRLFSFTAVPEAGYAPAAAPNGFIDDETPQVLALQAMYPNLTPTFVSAPGKNAWDERGALYAVLETPCKTLQNLVWMLESCRLAAAGGCRVLLTGQYGNITVSFGNFSTLLYELLHRLHWVRLVRELNLLQRRYHASRKAMLQNLARPSPRSPGAAALLQGLFLRQDVFERNSCYARLKGGLAAGTTPMRAVRAYMYDQKALRQIGEAEMKLSLETGVLLRDPTRDKRLVALLLDFPYDQFCRGETPNRLIRGCMRERLPPEITQHPLRKGRQSADTVYRLQPHWARISAELERAFALEAPAAWLDRDKLRAALARYPQLPADAPAFGLMRLLYHGLACEVLAGRW